MTRARPFFLFSFGIATAIGSPAVLSASAQQEPQETPNTLNASTVIGYSVSERSGTVTNVRSIGISDDRSINAETKQFPPDAFAVTVRFENGSEKAFIHKGEDAFVVGDAVNVVFEASGVRIVSAKED